MAQRKYILSDKFDSTQRQRAIRIIKQGVKSEQSSNEIQTRLKSEGLGYRRANVQDDIRQVKATIHAKTPEARERARQFYKKVYEPHRKKYGLTGDQATKQWEIARQRSKRIAAEAAKLKNAEAIAEFWESYKAGDIV